MQLSINGLQLLCELEGFRSCPYQDSKGIWTVGIGTTIYPDRTHISQFDPCITKEKALEYVNDYMQQIYKWLNDNLKWSPNQNQIDGLCCFLFNTGIGSKFNSYTHTKAAIIAGSSNITNEMKSIKNGGLLDSRREKECSMFLTGEWSN